MLAPIEEKNEEKKDDHGDEPDDCDQD